VVEIELHDAFVMNVSKSTNIVCHPGRAMNTLSLNHTERCRTEQLERQVQLWRADVIRFLWRSSKYEQKRLTSYKRGRTGVATTPAHLDCFGARRICDRMRASLWWLFG